MRFVRFVRPKTILPATQACTRSLFRAARKVAALQAFQSCPRPESNQCTRFRKPLLYPLSYGGAMPLSVEREPRGLTSAPAAENAAGAVEWSRKLLRVLGDAALERAVLRVERRHIGVPLGRARGRGGGDGLEPGLCLCGCGRRHALAERVGARAEGRCERRGARVQRRAAGRRP